jgi:hypothetical protein
MNPLAIEKSLKSALAASAFQTTTIYTGTSFEELTPESLNLIVSVDSLNAVAIGLYTAKATVRVYSPALLGEDSYKEFADVIGALKGALTQSYLLANWPTSDAPNFSGAYLTDISTGRENHCWTAEMTLTLGVID